MSSSINPRSSEESESVISKQKLDTATSSPFAARTTSSQSPIYSLLPIELIEKIIVWIATSTYQTIPPDLKNQKSLSYLSRIERVGGRWMVLAEKYLCQNIAITTFQSMQLLSLLPANDKRFEYVTEVKMFFLSGPVAGEVFDQSQRKVLHAFYARLKKLETLSLNIHHFLWQEMELVSVHVQGLKSLTLSVYGFGVEDDGEEEEVELDPVSIADITSLHSLKNLSYDSHSEGEDLSYFFGLTVWKNLDTLVLDNSTYSDISPLFDQMPSLSNLHISQSSILKLSSIGSPNLTHQFQNLNQQPFYLTHCYAYANPQFDYGFLPFLPPSIQAIYLDSVDLYKLIAVLELCKKEDINLKRLVILGESTVPKKSEETLKVEWDRVEEQCKRLGIELKEWYVGNRIRHYQIADESSPLHFLCILPPIF